MLPRSVDVVSLVDTFVVSAISSLMLVRLYLFLSGYPQVGGGGLHVAHMVWGGALMLIALLTSISFVSIGSRWMTALLGGAGFGLFVDEIGKFLTSDNNYFFRPAPALIYVTLVVVFLSARALARRRDFTSEEYVTNAIDLLKEAAVHDFDRLERRKLLRLLGHADDTELSRALRTLVHDLPPPKKLSRAQLARRALARRYMRLVRTHWFARLFAAIVVAGGLAGVVEVFVILWVRDGDLLEAVNLIGAVEITAALAATGFGLFGFRWDAHHPSGLRAMERSVLISILIVQPFAFYEAQFFASAGILVSMPILGTIEYALHEETRRRARAADETKWH